MSDLSRRTWLAAAVAGAVLAAGAAWWLLNPGALASVANAIEIETAGPSAMTSEVVTVTRPVELVDVRPADPPPEGVSVRLVACRWRDPLQPYAAMRGALDDHCADTAPVAGLRIAPRESRPVPGDGTTVATREWEVLAVVDLGDAPSYETEGFVVEYRDGLRRGRGTTGTRLRVHRSG